MSANNRGFLDYSYIIKVIILYFLKVNTLDFY